MEKRYSSRLIVSQVSTAATVHLSSFIKKAQKNWVQRIQERVGRHISSLASPELNQEVLLQVSIRKF
jgi:hypothetical protein